MKKILILIAAITLSMASFAREYSYEKDILYKGAPDGYTEKMCRIDVAYEKGGEGRPVIIWFHGGGLTKGKRSTPEALQQNGAVVVGVGYRFVSDNHFRLHNERASNPNPLSLSTRKFVRIASCVFGD